jgi:hypothetical protein
MKVSVEDVVVPVFQGTNRSPGVHVSGIIRCIATEAGLLNANTVEELSLIEVIPSTRFLDPVVALRVSIGLAWESWYIPNILGPEGVVDHPGEWECDGIYMSPDGEEVATIVVDRKPKHVIKVHEVKATYKSTNTVGETEEDLHAQFLWMAQLKAYCRGANTRWADLHVLFLNGDYKYPLQPRKKRFRLEFEQYEIDENWELLKNYSYYKGND